MTSPVPSGPALARFANLATLVLVTAVLYLASDVLVPIALALLLSFVLAPLVRWLERHGLQRTLAMLAVVVTLFAAVVGIGWLATREVVNLAASLPSYRENLNDKLAFLAGDGGGAMRPLGDLVEEVRGLFAGGEEAPAADRPVPVTVVDPGLDTFPLLRSLLGPLVHPLATAGIVFVLVLFMLIAWDSLRDRLLRLTGNDQLGVTTDVIQDAARRVSHYLLAQLLVNASIGVVIGVGLFLLGMPNAVLWGLLSALLRYIPFIGGVVASLLPITISIITSPGWTQPLLIVGLIVAVELITNNLVEPWLYGHNTGLSSIGILAAAIFWGWLWGGVGLILATPLTVCLVVMSRHLPQLAFIHVLLSKDEALSPPERLYQRLLSLDAEEAAKVVVGQRFESVDAMFDQLIAPSLELAERGRERLSLVPERQRFVYENLRCFIDDAPVASTAEAPVDASGRGADVLCIPARTEADELVARMYARALRSGGHHALPLPATLTTSDIVGEIAARGVTVACIAALHPFSLVVAGELCRKIRAHYPELRIVVGIWGLPHDADTRRAQLVSSGADGVAGDVGQIFETLGVGPASEPQRPEAIAHALESALLAYDASTAESLLDRALREHPLESLCVEAIQPTLVAVGTGWEEGRVSVEQEHFATNFFRRKLLNFIDTLPASSADAPRAIACCAPDEQHEIGLVILTLLLRRRGWQVVYLGQRVPSEGLTEAVAGVRPHVVLFSATLPRSAEWLGRIADLIATFDPPPHLVFGGRAFLTDPTLPDRLPGTVLTGDARAAVEYLVELLQREHDTTAPGTTQARPSTSYA